MALENPSETLENQCRHCFFVLRFCWQNCIKNPPPQLDLVIRLMLRGAPWEPMCKNHCKVCTHMSKSAIPSETSCKSDPPPRGPKWRLARVFYIRCFTFCMCLLCHGRDCSFCLANCIFLAIVAPLRLDHGSRKPKRNA